MNELFETVVILSLFGSVITSLLLLLKPVTLKKFPAQWQYWVWLAVMISMVIPIYKFIPKQEAQRLYYITKTESVQQEIIQEVPAENSTEITGDKREKIKLKELLPYVWITGVCIYISVVAVSYAIYLLRKRKSSFLIAVSPVLEDVKKELGIKRKIRLKISRDIISPMLIGVFLPTIYIPAKSISDENMRMIFLHELTHYKRRDLTVKWFSLFVNAVHWFNPLAYVLCKNISEACELSCDMAVTRAMTEDEQKNYMKTILESAEQG